MYSCPSHSCAQPPSASCLLDRTSLCATPSAPQRCRDMTSMLWGDIYGIKLSCYDGLFCEMKQPKQHHLRAQFAPEILLAVFSDLADDTAMSVRRGPEMAEQVLSPPVFVLDAGVPCVSRAPLNSKYMANINCAQETREATGIAFNKILAA
eukprot:5793590-Pyramimonas_sp.AAC.1